MATQELFAQVIQFAELDEDQGIAAEVERRFAAFKAGEECGLSHEEVFASARAMLE